MISDDNIKVTLDAPDDSHHPTPSAEMNKRMGLMAARLAALVRLQYLQEKRDRQSRSALVLPTQADEEAEFRRLMDWWRSIGVERQNNLMLAATDLACQILLIEQGGFGL